MRGFIVWWRDNEHIVIEEGEPVVRNREGGVNVFPESGYLFMARGGSLNFPALVQVVEVDADMGRDGFKWAPVRWIRELGQREFLDMCLGTWFDDVHTYVVGKKSIWKMGGQFRDAVGDVRWTIVGEDYYYWTKVGE